MTIIPRGGSLPEEVSLHDCIAHIFRSCCWSGCVLFLIVGMTGILAYCPMMQGSLKTAATRDSFWLLHVAKLRIAWRAWK
ncbi:MAG: hypothetical protein HN811_04245 [Phycisphaerae bacterium]|nr:hypothetical protein [Phycisphaerae bacterium]